MENQNQKLKTSLNLTKDQLQTIVNEHIIKENGINDIYEALINGLMLSERTVFLEKQIGSTNKGNGYRNIIKSGIGSKLELSIPRDRLGLFKPMILGLLNQEEERIKELSFELYGKGLTTRQISEILKQVYGINYSKSNISRISEQFYEHIENWMERRLEKFYPIIFIDALYLKVKRDTVGTEAFYIVLGLKEDFTREILAIINFPTESASGWKEVLTSIKSRGVEEVGLFVFDDLKSLDSSISQVFKESKQQKCILHFQRNLSKNVRIKDRVEFCGGLKKLFDPDVDKTLYEAEYNLKKYLKNWEKKYPSIKSTIERKDLELLFTYLTYNKKIRRMIYTTNWIERFNKSVKRTTKIRNSLPNPKSALMLIGFVGMEFEEKSYKYPINIFNLEEQMIVKMNC